MDVIVFNVGTNRYALGIENIQRIIQAKELTTMPNANALIDGMMNYENNILKVIGFRKLIGLPAYDKELYTFFTRLKTDYQNFLDALKDSIESGSAFRHSLNPNKCELGVWLNNFNSYDAELSKILKSLIENYRRLYASASNALELRESDKNKAIEFLKTDTQNLFNRMIGDMNIFIDNLEIVANSLQKMIIYQKEESRFAIKVDSIEDIVDAQEEMIMKSDEDNGKELQLYGVLDINGHLVNVIKNIQIPTKGEIHGN